ncbi:MAG: lipid-A-disaccharide synthase, partial [Burkholderiales bacterium]|nr:lipid-A-disaccharide synthase [Burkholderiales bacterium]
MRLFFSVGEPSGDLHGSNVIRALREQEPSIECVGYGGPLMRAAGFRQHYDLCENAIMGVSRAIRAIPQMRRLLKNADEYFRLHRPDAVVMIDYPGFNWHIARRAKARGIPVFYYGVPQLWAWASWRVKKRRRLIDHALCKLPFEEQWFRERGVNATYVGHPFFDQLEAQQLD